VIFLINKAAFSRAFADPLTERSAGTDEKSGILRASLTHPSLSSKRRRRISAAPSLPSIYAPSFQHVHHHTYHLLAFSQSIQPLVESCKETKNGERSSSEILAVGALHHLDEHLNSS
jgi:hypothetical protein